MTQMVKIENMVLDPVLPISVIGTNMDGQVNFMTASWFTRLELVSDEILDDRGRSGSTMEP